MSNLDKVLLDGNRREALEFAAGYAGLLDKIHRVESGELDYHGCWSGVQWEFEDKEGAVSFLKDRAADMAHLYLEGIEKLVADRADYNPAIFQLISGKDEEDGSA